MSSSAWERAKRNLHRPKMMPDMLTFDEARALFRLSKKGFGAKARRDFWPIGGMTYSGSHERRKGKRLFHAWAIAYMLRMTDNCPGCGRPYPLFPGDCGD